MTQRPQKSLAQMAREAAGPPQSIAGKPAHVCPACGAGMFIDGVNRTEHDIVRYVQCRNKRCGKRFVSRQPPAKLVREVDGEDSVGGNASLTVVRDSA